MKRSFLTLIACVASFGLTTPQNAPASIIFDDFNVNEGHFNQVPTFSGSTAGILASSTADRVTTGGPIEGAGHEQLVFNTNGAAAVRVRFLSGTGTPANNTSFTTSAGADGWLGCFVKTTNAGWTVQIWIEGAPSGNNNGGNQKEVIADGAWHVYEWDLDDTSGGPDGWGDVQNIVTGNPTVADISHTIDSIIFRNAAVTDATSVVFMDFVAKSDSGSISNLLLEPCLATTGVLVSGPVSTNSDQVIVSGVSGTATKITVYQNSGPGMVAIGSKTSGITAGNNSVAVSGLVKAAQVAATQTVAGQESCVPPTGLFVGGGANPSVRVALTIRETTSTGPVGDPGDSTSGNLHFLGASTVSGGAPVDAQIFYPSNGWQTLTFLRGTNEVVGDSANATGTPLNAAGYAANDIVSIQAYAYRTLPNGVSIYSVTPTTSADVTSNNVFGVKWTWGAVSSAQGYRILRSLNFAGYGDFIDLTANSLTDTNFGWTAGGTVTPTTSQPGRSVQWNPSVSNTNNLPGQWGILESVNFAISDLDNTGPFDLYIDNLQSEATVFQTFEAAPANATDYGFRQPSFSGTTGGSILPAPNVGEVSNAAADGGNKSFHVRFQWSGTNAAKWLRLTTSGVNNPQVNLDQPITLRLLMQPVNATLPALPAAPVLTASSLNNQTVLTWTGGHRLQTSVNVSGTYTNVPQVLSPNTWTNITLGAFLAPWTNSFTEPIRFFRLAD